MAKRVAVIGGGAAGFFAAINVKLQRSDLEVFILEQSQKTLQKVRVSGGGRCNVTNARSKAGDLVNFYPRGGKKLYKLFKAFSTEDMRKWLASHGVNTREEPDHRVFPVSNQSQQIIDCFERLCRKYEIRVLKGEKVTSMEQTENAWIIHSSHTHYEVDSVVVATGSGQAFWKILKQKGLKINAPVPSLFTFHIDDGRLKGLQGLSFPNAKMKVTGTKLNASGPLLITHWGLSGPATLKLSAWGARALAECKYTFDVIINYVGYRFDDFKALLRQMIHSHPQKKVVNMIPADLPRRFWERIIQYTQVAHKSYGELGKTDVNRLCEELTQGRYHVHGKSPFKEEFVTCGGVDLSEVDLNTMESKNLPGLYFSGEVLDIDGLTGGFNFQACWSASWVIAGHLADNL